MLRVTHNSTAPAAKKGIFFGRNERKEPSGLQELQGSFPGRVPGQHGRNDVGRAIESRRLELGNHGG